MLKRRNLITGTGAVTVAALVGCLGNDDENQDSPEDPDSEDPSNGDDLDSEDPSNGDDPDSENPSNGEVVELGEPQQGTLTYGCMLDGTVDIPPEVRVSSQDIKILGHFIMPSGEDSLTPAIVGIEQESDGGTITITTAFTNDEPDERQSFSETTGVEPSNCEYPLVGIYYSIPAADEANEIPTGTDVYWNVEYPDGRVDEPVADGTV